MEKIRDKPSWAGATQQPLISIITVVLNGADTLEQAIKSVVTQKFRDFKYIIIDGGSTDGTLDIIRRYESHLTCWISEPDRGLYDAMNKGVALAKGEWTYFLGADDYLLDGFTAAAERLKDGTTVYYGNVYRPVAGRIYVVEDRIPRVYPWMNEPGGGIMLPWNTLKRHIVSTIFDTTLFGYANTADGS